MYYLKDMCCLCLNVSNALYDMCSITKDELSHFDKISFSLARIANVIELENYLLCKRCCDIVDMIYQFNKVCLKNIETFNSYTEILKEERDKKSRIISVKLIKTNIDVKFDNHMDVPEYCVTKEKLTKTNNNDAKHEEINEVLPINNHYDSDTSNISESVNDYIVTNDAMLNINRTNIETKSEISTINICDPMIEVKVEIGDIELKKENSEAIGNISSTDVVNLEKPPSKAANVMLNKIERSKQKSIPKYFCLQCGKSYISSGGLHNHQRLHNGTKPYKCDICNKLLSYKISLQKHKFSFHPDECPICNICNKKFALKCDLEKHKCNFLKS